MDPSIIFFFILAGLLVLSSVMVVFLRNVVHAAVALVAALLLIAVFFVTLQAPMVGVLQVMVYAGAIMVLFLFVIMLLNPGAAERRAAWWGVGAAMALIFGLQMAALLSAGRSQSGRSAALPEDFGSPEALGRSLFQDFVLPFEIAGVLLLVAVIGAVALAKRGN
jgi:NADH-quinone oxidoreductase subunit J